MKRCFLQIYLLIVILICLAYYLIFSECSEVFIVNAIIASAMAYFVVKFLSDLNDKNTIKNKILAEDCALIIASCIAFLWTNIASFCIQDDESHIKLFIGLLIIAIIGLICFGISNVGGRKSEELLSETDAVLQSCNDRKKENYKLMIDFENSMHNAEFSINKNLYKQCHSIFEKINSIPIEKQHEGQYISDYVEAELSELQTRIETKSITEKELTDKLEALNRYVNQQKKLL